MPTSATYTDPSIDAGTLAAYHNDGVTVLRNVVDAHWRERIGAAIERDIANPGPYYHGYVPDGGKGKFHGNIRIFENDTAFNEFCLSSTLPAIARAFFDSQRINLLYDQLFVKEPSTVNSTRWHNDQPYWPISGSQVLSFWIALDRTTKDSGALEFVRRSHRWGKWFQPEKFGDTKGHDDYERNPDYVPMPDIDSARADYEILTWDLEPGDVYVFHGLTVHGAGGNHREDVRRRGYAVRYTGDDVRYDTRPGTNEHLRSAAAEHGAMLSGARYPLVFG